MNIKSFKIATLMPIDQFYMIYPKEMEKGDKCFVFNLSETKLVSHSETKFKNNIRRILLFDTKRFSIIYKIFESELYSVAPRYSERADGHVKVAGDQEIRCIDPKG